MSVTVQEREAAFNIRLQTYAIVNDGHIDIGDFFNNAFEIFGNRQRRLITDHFIIKTYTIFVGEFSKDVGNGDGVVEEIFQIFYLHGGTQLIDIDTDLSEWYDEQVVERHKAAIEDLRVSGSGWRLSSIIELTVANNSCEPMRGSSYLPLPPYVASKGAAINVQNSDQKCFQWAVLSRLHPAATNAQRVSKYRQFANELNFSGIRFPVSVDQINKFERLNPTVSINVYIYDPESANKIVPIRLTKDRKGGQRHVNLLLLQKTDGADGADGEYVTDLNADVSVKTHYCWIKDQRDF